MRGGPSPQNNNNNNTKTPGRLKTPPGPQEMLCSGRWDATSQLLDRDEQLKDLARKLPYLFQFQPA